MGYDFNADEVFGIAEQIEKNGAAFYSEAAGKTSNVSIRQFLLDLASMEEGHRKVFSSMRAALSDQEREQTTFDPEGETSKYLQALAGLSVFDDKIRHTPLSPEGSSDAEGMRSVLGRALGLEKDSIVFYLGLKDLISEPLGKDRVEQIIKEEMKHIRLLGSKLSSLEK
jgi:rubrerythrin